MKQTNRTSKSLNRRVKCRNCETTLYAGADVCDECGSTDIDTAWNSLQSAYSKHDIGEAYFGGRLEQMGLHVENWGIDKRHHDDGLIFDNKMDLRLWEPLDGQETPPPIWPPDKFEGQRFASADIDGMFEVPKADDAAYADTREWELRGIADVKTKASKDWLGKFNLRHMVHYSEWASYYNVPVFIYMTMVNPEQKSVGEQHFLVELPPDWSDAGLSDHYDRDRDYSMSYGELKDAARTCSIVKSTFRAPDGNLVVNVDEDSRRDFDYIVENIL